MTNLDEARSALSGRLEFGNDDQIRAHRFLVTVEEAKDFLYGDVLYGEPTVAELHDLPLEMRAAAISARCKEVLP